MSVNVDVDDCTLIRYINNIPEDASLWSEIQRQLSGDSITSVSVTTREIKIVTSGSRIFRIYGNFPYVTLATLYELEMTIDRQINYFEIRLYYDEDYPQHRNLWIETSDLFIEIICDSRENVVIKLDNPTSDIEKESNLPLSQNNNI
jgi:hypothetical protein